MKRGVRWFEPSSSGVPSSTQNQTFLADTPSLYGKSNRIMK